MKRSYVFIGLVSFVFFSLSICEAQNASSFDRVPVSERIYFGGGGSLSAGVHPYYGRYTYIAINPMVGYMVTPKFSFGSFVNFQHYSYTDVNPSVSNNQYGISPFLQYRIKNIFAYAEYSILSVPSYDNSSRKIYTRFPAGLGYSMPLGGKASLNAMALYDLKYKSQSSPFGSPWVIRVFVSVGRLSF